MEHDYSSKVFHFICGEFLLNVKDLDLKVNHLSKPKRSS